MKTALFFILLFVYSITYSQERRQGKKYEFIDLGKLQIEGEFMTPTEIIIQEQQKKGFEQDIYDRKNFRRENYIDIYNLQ